ncbi:MAG: hypothetical protein RIE77_13845 [Phycisphaerales bacterium]|jgi:hypothetical protein
MRGMVLIVVAGTCGAALGQSLQIQFANPTLNPGETTVVTLSASYGSGDYAIAGIATDLIASSGSDGWSDLELVASMDGPGTTAGAPSATGIDGIIAGQLNIPIAGIYADGSNPIAFWRATYTSPAIVGSAFDLEVSTVTSRFDVYVSRGSATSESRLADLTEARGGIFVVPAPSGAAVLGAGLIAGFRRRRRSA